MSKIISFAKTTKALLYGIVDCQTGGLVFKDVTRRDWADHYARRFKAGDVCQAYDRSQPTHATKVAEIRIKSIKLEPIRALIMDPKYGAEEMRREGFPGRPPYELVKILLARTRRTDGNVYRLEFEKISAVVGMDLA